MNCRTIVSVLVLNIHNILPPDVKPPVQNICHITDVTIVSRK